MSQMLDGERVGRDGSTAMLRSVIALAAASLFGAALIPTDALAFGCTWVCGYDY
jgi:hypothetical protein